MQPTSTVIQNGQQSAVIFLHRFESPDESFSYRTNKTIIVLKADTKNDTMAILNNLFTFT